MQRNGMAAVMGAALVACCGMVRASDELSLKQPIRADETAMQAPLASAMDRIGIGKPLNDAGFKVGGWAEGSYTYNVDSPDSGVNVGRVFDFEHDLPLINQIVVYGERTVDASKAQWDIGGRVEFMWGSDARLIHSNGLFDWYDPIPDGPQQQFDLTQAYLTIATPIKGLSFTAGKFVTLIGQETINPTTNLFYSHSYLFGFAIPFTHTGVLATYMVDDKLSITGGVTLGWEQGTFDDNNHSVDILGQVKYALNDKLSLLFNFSVGPQNAADSRNYRYLLNPIVAYTFSDQLTLAADFVYGFDELDDAQWYGVAGYASYTVNDSLKANGRVEYFNDQDGSRGLGTYVLEATVGVQYKPFPKDPIGQGLSFRPEARIDYADEGIFNDGGDNVQVTVGADLIYAF